MGLCLKNKEKIFEINIVSSCVVLTYNANKIDCGNSIHLFIRP